MYFILLLLFILHVRDFVIYGNCVNLACISVTGRQLTKCITTINIAMKYNARSLCYSKFELSYGVNSDN